MPTVEISTICWLLLAVQVLGLTSAWVTRLCRTPRRQTVCQCVFLLAMVLVGGSTIAAFALGPFYYLPTGVTLSLMVLGAVVDFRPDRAAAAW